VTAGRPADPVPVHPGLDLVPLAPATAADIVAGAREDHRWAADFPAEGDLVVAGLVVLAAEAAGPTAPAADLADPYAGPWQVVQDGWTVGLLGFKGRPVDGVVEVGYGIVPSARGRGVATAAVRVLLGLVTPDVVAYRKRQPVGRENLGGLEFIRARKPDYLAIFPDWFPNLKGAHFLQQVFAADVKDNTASEWDFVPKLRTVAGVLVTGLEVEPVRSMTVVFKCDWTQETGVLQ
jgi:hypothetical protein